jgi:uncharacterized protein (DUF983 family)
MYLKSQLFLGSSFVSAIAFVGCIFELTSGEPQWGQTFTWAILLTSVPITVVMFLTAVRMAKTALGTDRD